MQECLFLCVRGFVSWNCHFHLVFIYRFLFNPSEQFVPCWYILTHTDRVLTWQQFLSKHLQVYLPQQDLLQLLPTMKLKQFNQQIKKKKKKIAEKCKEYNTHVRQEWWKLICQDLSSLRILNSPRGSLITIRRYIIYAYSRTKSSSCNLSLSLSQLLIVFVASFKASNLCPKSQIA